MLRDVGFLEAIMSPDRVSSHESARAERATDWGTDHGTEPDVVVWPASTEEVSATLEAATRRELPVTPYAAGTSIEGNPIPVHGGISMDLTRMDSVLEIRPADHQIDVEPGVLGDAIDDAAGDHGLFFPPLPSSGDISTIGGMIANAASGMGTVKYGEIADWVLELEAVLADGSVITAGSKASKTSSGYNLRDLIVGSEGTLAVVTRATLELAGRPRQVRGGRALFSELDDAADAVADAVQSGVDVAKIELIDRDSARISNAYTGESLPDVPMVFLEFHAEHGVDDEVAFCEGIFAEHGVERFEMADEEEMADLWRARRELAVAIRASDPDRDIGHPGDVTVPISEYGSTVTRVKRLAEEYDLSIPCFGHAGDGNVHYIVLVDEDDPDELERSAAAQEAIIDHVLDVGGTVTGEHGIGLGKRDYLVREHGEASVAAMRAVKRALDPTNTLNPGKILPDQSD
ncbi:FAD-binding oxidoreductase [Halorubrum luteum]